MARRTSKSTKSGSGSKSRGTKSGWALRKTLARDVSFRPMETEDIRWAYAGYKQGALASMGGVFEDTEAMDSEQFAAEFTATLETVYHGAWTMTAPTGRGVVPVGFVVGFFSHPLPEYAPFMIVGDMVWYSWASPRNKVECAVNFFANARLEVPFMEYAEEPQKRFFETICKHGVMRRVGKSYNVHKGQEVTIFETVARTH